MAQTALLKPQRFLKQVSDLQMVCCYTTFRVLTDNLWALEFLEEFKHQIVEPQTCHNLLKRQMKN